MYHFPKTDTERSPNAIFFGSSALCVKMGMEYPEPLCSQVPIRHNRSRCSLLFRLKLDSFGNPSVYRSLTDCRGCECNMRIYALQSLLRHSDPAACAFIRKFLQFAVFLNRQAAVPVAPPNNLVLHVPCHPPFVRGCART